MMEGCSPEVQTAALAALTSVAAAHKAAGGEILFFSATKPSMGPVDQIRKLCKLPEAAPGTPTLLMLDIPDNGGYYVCESSEVSEESVSAFIAAHTAKTIERKQLG